MEYRRFGDALVVRIDKDEEIVEQLTLLAERENIALASVEAIAGVREVEFGIYDAAEHQYHPHCLSGFFEVTSLMGTVTEMNGKPYLHLHIGLSDESGQVQGGHLKRAVVGATCEMVVRVIGGKVGRKHDAATGLNLFCFDEP